MKEKDNIQNETLMEPELAEEAKERAEVASEVKAEKEAIETLKKFATEDDDDDMGELSLRAILGGDILQSRFIMKQVLFIMFCVFLSLLYTGNRYASQQDSIVIDSLRVRLQEVKYNVLTQSSELMNSSRQSNIENRLKSTKDSVLQSPIIPPFLIESNSPDNEE